MSCVFIDQPNQYGRRKKTSNLWVVKSSAVYALSNEDENFFDTVPDKDYREAWGFKVRDKINLFKKEKKIRQNL